MKRYRLLLEAVVQYVAIGHRNPFLAIALSLLTFVYLLLSVLLVKIDFVTVVTNFFLLSLSWAEWEKRRRRIQSDLLMSLRISPRLPKGDSDAESTDPR